MKFNTRPLARIFFKPKNGAWVNLASASIKGGGLSSSWYTFWVALTEVSISGNPRDGQTLTANTKPETATPTGYQWYRNNVAISGATGKTYVVQTADVGQYLTVRAYASTSYVESTSQLIYMTSLNISGTVRYNSTLTAMPVPTSLTYTYQWYRGTTNTPISGATSKTYRIQADDVGYQIHCIAKVGNAQATNHTAYVPINSVSISGTTTVGNTLTANVVPSTTYTYQWYRGDSPITGATSSTYKLVDADNGYNIKVTVRRGSSIVTSSETSVVKKYTHKTGTLASWEGYLGRFQDPKTTVVLAIPSNTYVDAISMVGTAHNYNSTISYVARATINYPTAATVISQDFRLDPDQSQSFDLSKEGLFSTYGTQAQTQVEFYVGESTNTNALRNQTNEDKWSFKITSWYVLE